MRRGARLYTHGQKAHWVWALFWYSLLGIRNDLKMSGRLRSISPR